MGLTPDIVRIVSFFLSFLCPFLAHTLKIKAHGSQTHGKAKAKTAALVETLYGFDSRQTKKAIAKTHRKAEELKSEKGFVFEVCVLILFVFLLNLIYRVRYLQIQMASKKEYTNIQLFKRLLT